MNRWEQAEAERRAREEKRAADRAKRRAELDYFSQIEVQRAAQRLIAEAEHDAFAKRVQAAHEASARGEIDPEESRKIVPTLDSIYQAKWQAKLAAEAAAEQAARAAMTPRERYISTLSVADRMHIATWEGVNHMPYPIPGLA